MKRTDIERRDRELKRSKKKEVAQLRKTEKGVDELAIEYSEKLFKLFFYDEEKIYNIKQSIEILELLEEMKTELPEKNLDNVLRKAIRLTKVKGKKQAFDEIKAL